ncbi:MAG: PAS domain S-box protein [Candidatus Xenobiia bacterium LiM19]
MNNTLSNELFLLMVNLGTIRDRTRIVQLFTEALSELFEGIEFNFSTEKDLEAPHLIDVCTSQHHFGRLMIRGPWDSVPSEKAALIRNAIMMLALILENRIQAERLASEKELLESAVVQRTADLILLNQDLQRMIEEKERAKEALREKTEELEQYFNSSLDLLAIADTDGYFRRLNREWEKVLGYELSELEGKSLLDFVHPDDQEPTWAALSQLSEQKEVLNFTNRYKRRDGSYRWIEWRAFPRGKSVYATARDVTKRREAEKALIDANERLALAQKSADAGVWDWDIKSGKLNWSPELFSLYGLDPDKHIASFDTWRSVILPVDLSEAESRIYEAIRDCITLRNEYRIIRPSGEIRWISAAGNAQYDPNGEPFRMLGICIDVTNNKNAEEALRESEEKFRTAFRTGPDMMAITSLIDGTYLDVNNAFLELTGYTRQEIIGRSAIDLNIWVKAGDRDKMASEIARCGHVTNYEAQFRMKDGRILNCLSSASITMIGGVPHVLSIVKNIDHIRQAEEERARLATAIEQSAETIVITDVAGTIVYVNPAFEKTSGYSSAESLGAKPSILKSGLQDDLFYRTLWKTIARGAVWSGHFTNRKKDGTLYEEKATISPVKDDSGTIVNYVAVKEDVTNEVSLQKQLLQSQKMEAVGKLAGGVAHDFNNMLQIIIGFSELLIKRMKEDTTEYEDLGKILETSRNAADLVRSLLTFSRKVEPMFLPLNINNNVVQIKKILERTLPRIIAIKTLLSTGLRDIYADTIQIEQVLMNLALNARDAMPEGGTLTFETRNVTLDEAWCSLHLGFSEGDYVKLTVSDTGQGMSKDTVERIFEPFFTTKKIGSGTGLGLAIVYGIVQQHNGCISCDSKPGNGTAFDLYFKAMKDESKPAEAEVDAVPSARGNGTLLLVDDEESIRVLGNRILAEAGYKVLLAQNGREALELFRKEHEHISLVILDLSMPAMNGRDCLKEIISLDHHVKIIIMSGYTEEIAPEEFSNLDTVAFLGKPFRFFELLQKVHMLLEA